MSTRCLIGWYEIDTDTVYYTYCHFDGYPSGVGQTLFKHYQNFQKIRELVSLNGFEALEETVEETKRTEYKMRYNNGTMNFTNYRKTTECGIEYKYLYMDNAWFFLPSYFEYLDEETCGLPC